MKVLEIRQGDQGMVPVKCWMNGEVLDIGDIDGAEFTIGHALRFTWPETVAWEEGTFYLPLTQEETFRMRPGLIPVEGRLRFRDDRLWVIGSKKDMFLLVRECASGVKM